MGLNLSLDFQFESPIKKVWLALTDTEILAKWMIFTNDFKPVVGHKFQFRTEPTEWWNGIVDCEVLEVKDPHKLSYTWVSGGESLVVTLTLTHEDSTNNLHLEQTGFESEDQTYSGAKNGWTQMTGELEKVLAEL